MSSQYVCLKSAVALYYNGIALLIHVLVLEIGVKKDKFMGWKCSKYVMKCLNR